ncbi:hypothetical protein CYMTET_41260 [Cymbomonas tetramitiformis]|uniref:Uncharacterized protein n=1 Tax=Cymbomonas tetramitiformis TaxID=36881 RepID=A0AAE0C8H9_9CHLO|nr:hypothetical protein CYMTET_41260 [Cymbomonas tetramitiformis]
MLSVANVAAQVLSNESAVSLDESEPIDMTMLARRKGVEARLSRLNDTIAAAESMIKFASGPHVSSLMDATALFLAETLSKVNMDGVNTLIATFGKDEYLNHSLTLADKAMGKIDVYEVAARRMAVMMARAWVQNEHPVSVDDSAAYAYAPIRDRSAERHRNLYDAPWN